jgi:cell division protein FtsA
MFITIPGLKGLAAKEVSVKSLAKIIQARTSEILDFVTYHLKQVGLDNRSLNGGIILTGGGSQLKHLLQLTEYLTGLNARIGIPNEHLAGEMAEKLALPMYSTCIGLILKGYNDYENLNKMSEENFIRVTGEVAEATEVALEMPEQILEEPKPEVPSDIPQDTAGENKGVDMTHRNKLKGFLDNIKNNLIDLFKEEEDVRF